MGLTLILILITAAIIVLLTGGLLFQPAKLAVKVAVNSFFGLLILWMVNFAGAYLGLKIPLNPFTVLVTGLLGIPGLAMLGLLEMISK